MPRRKKGVEARDRINFHFHCTTEAYTRYGKLLQYLSSDKTKLPLREMVLQAAAAFWMPFAHRYLNDLSLQELQHSAARSIYQLQVRILDLEESFGSRRIGKHSFSSSDEEVLVSSIDNDVLSLDADLVEVEFDFRCQMRAETNYGKLLQYLKSDDTELPLREMVLQATAAFWMPFAHKYLNLSSEELQQSVNRAIEQLQKQIFYLESRFTTRRLVESSSSDSTPEQPLSSIDNSFIQPNSDSTDSAVILTTISSASEWQDLDF